MKKLYFYLQQVMVLMVIILTVFALDATITAITGGAVAYASLTGLLVKAFSDPQTKQSWETMAFRLGEEKTEFNEAEIGTTFTDDGPRPSNLTSAPPILYYNELNDGGRKVNIRYNQPLLEGVTEIMSAGRYASQDRLGYEEAMKVQHVTAIVDMLHLGVREDEVEQGTQFTANMGLGDVVSAFVDKMSDYHAKRKDYGLFYGFFARYDLHLFTNAAIRAGLSNNDKPVADADGGLLSPPREHPDSYVFHKTSNVEVFEKITYHDTAATHSNNIATAVSKITSAAKPTIALMYYIMRTCERRNMIPCRMRMEDGRIHKYFMVYMPGRMKDLLEQDDEVRKLFTAAYQGMVEKNPLLRQGDIVWKNLIIRDSNILENQEFSYKYHFNDDGGTNADDAKFVIVGSDVKTGKVGITFGETGFVTSSAADDESGLTTSMIGRIMVLGANSILKVSGKRFELEAMELSQYGRDSGLGQTHFFGNQLVVRREHGTSGLTTPTAPQSFQVFAFMGDN